MYVRGRKVSFLRAITHRLILGGQMIKQKCSFLVCRSVALEMEGRRILPSDILHELSGGLQAIFKIYTLTQPFIRRCSHDFFGFRSRQRLPSYYMLLESVRSPMRAACSAEVCKQRKKTGPPQSIGLICLFEQSELNCDFVYLRLETLLKTWIK